MFAVLFAGPGGVEIAERDEIQFVDLLIPNQHLFKHQLGLAIGINRPLGQILRHRHTIRRPVSRAGGAENKLFNAAFHRRVRQLQGVHQIVMKILLGVRHGLAHQRIRGEMHDGIRLDALDGLQDVTLHLRLRENELRPRVHRRPMPFREIIINRDRMAGIQQLLRANRTNVPRPARNKYFHPVTMHG